MPSRHGTEFRREAVRVALTSGLTRKQIATDLGVGFSTLNNWVQQDRDKDLMTGPHDDQEKEITRLRKENRILREEREVLKKRRCSSRAKNDAVCIHRSLEEDLSNSPYVQGPGRHFTRLSCLAVSSHGPASAPSRQRFACLPAMDDMVLLAHIREQYKLSLGSYGRPRMTEELQELGLKVGHRRVGRLMLPSPKIPVSSVR